MSYKFFPPSFMYQDHKASLSFCGFSYPLIIVSLLFLFAQGGSCSQESWTKDTLLYEEKFDSESLHNWKSELHKPDVSVVKIQDGKLNIDVGGGATIWFKHKLEGDILIEYDVTVINKGGTNDRVSDLNQFWMALDPVNTNLFTRDGKFTEYDNLRLYYVGMGGNNNSTTRFRRYPGGGERPLLAEYTDPEFLLQPNTDYHIEIICFKGLTQFIVNGEVYFNFRDPDPLVEGNFGFRTVRNHETIDNFKVYRLVESKLSTLTKSLNATDRTVLPGESIQDAIDYVSANGGGIVTLAAGVHNITSPAQIKSNVTLQGEGNLASTLKTTSDIKMIIQAGYGLVNVTIRNLILMGSPTKNAGGIHLISNETDHDRIKLLGVHVFETGWGVHIKGAKNVSIEDCNFSRNGNPKSKGYAHNLYLRRCYTANVSNCIFNNSTSANGINISYSKDIQITNCEAIGNYFRGMRAADTDGFRVHNCVITDNGQVGLLANKEKSVTKNIDWKNNCVSNNGGKGIYARSGATGTCQNNNAYGNSDNYDLPDTVSQSGNASDSSRVRSSRVATAEIPLRFFVSLQGNDSWSGRLERPSSCGTDGPFRSLAAARDAARAYVGKETVTVYVSNGTYYLPDTLVFASEDSGSALHPVVYQADNEGQAILSGDSKLSLQWVHYRDGIFQAKTPAGLDIDQLFINGKRQHMARYPNYDARRPTIAYQGYAADAFSKERAAGWADPTGGYIHAMHRSRWGGYHYRITGKDSNGEVTYEGGWQNNRRSGMHREFQMVENIFEELDAPSEWFHNAKTGTLYYMPEAGTDLNKAVVEVVRLSHLIEFQGSVEVPVRFITLQGFVVRHAARTFMETKEPMLRSDWAIYRGGAVMLTGTEDIRILDCEFDQVGGNAVFVNNYNRRTVIKGCHIHDTGASGICFVGDPKAVRNPLFEYGQKNDLAKIDRTVGPKTDNYPALGTVEDCLIHGIGRVERQPAGVQIEMAMKITIRDTSVYDCARAGINIGDGCWGGHLIERCDVFDTVLETHDHGSFNSWGRDRYWRSDRDTSQKAIDVEPNLPFLDAMHTTTIRSSRWRCDHGWDIDLDDGSSNYEIYNNLLLNGGLKFREGFRRRAWNNIMVNNSFHPHVWYVNSGDEFFANIVMTDVKGIRAPTKTATGKYIDKNLFFVTDPKHKDKYAEQGWDMNSIVGDPLFVDPANGDFRVKEESPAFKIGFKNFPMDQFGVKKTSLKVITETPDIPVLGVIEEERVRSPAAPPTLYWLGAKVHGLVGEEFSAYGVRKEDGGVALMEIPDKSAAAQAGLKVNDLIQGINGHRVSDICSFFKVLFQIGSSPMTLKIVRHQQILALSIDAHPYLQLETAATQRGFSRLPLPTSHAGVVRANQRTHNDPLESLVDGRLSQGYGPVFGNGVHNGIYKMDLGRVQPVTAVTSWSYSQDRRGSQIVTLYGSHVENDPGWDLSKWAPIGSLDTTGTTGSVFTAVSLRAATGQILGKFRWIAWRVSPVTSVAGGENTAFQELSVDVLNPNME